MYIKWITCTVPESKKAQFSRAQEEWIGIQKAPGFWGQVGGWDLKARDTACILAFWQSRAALQAFMEEAHDEIFLKNQQDRYYSSIEVEHFNSVLDLPGATASFGQRLSRGRLLRIADCRVKHHRKEHFEVVQGQVWAPGMKKCMGMLGGTFSRGDASPERYLVASFWQSLDLHEHYVQTQLPTLQKRAAVKGDLTEITGRKIQVIDSWKVVPKSFPKDRTE